jgi:hypothetical protein
MSEKKLARHVQHELENDASLERPAYQWCLQQVRKFLPEARENAKGDTPKMVDDHVQGLLVANIKPLARRVRQ